MLSKTGSQNSLLLEYARSFVKVVAEGSMLLVDQVAWGAASSPLLFRGYLCARAQRLDGRSLGWGQSSCDFCFIRSKASAETCVHVEVAQNVARTVMNH